MENPQQVPKRDESPAEYGDRQRELAHGEAVEKAREHLGKLDAQLAGTVRAADEKLATEKFASASRFRETIARVLNGETDPELQQETLDSAAASWGIDKELVSLEVLQQLRQEVQANAPE